MIKALKKYKVFIITRNNTFIKDCDIIIQFPENIKKFIIKHGSGYYGPINPKKDLEHYLIVKDDFKHNNSLKKIQNEFPWKPSDLSKLNGLISENNGDFKKAKKYKKESKDLLNNASKYTKF